jgi:hypothetical protein
MIFIKLSIFILCIFITLMTGCYLFTKNRKYLFLARDGIKYLLSMGLIIVIIYLSLRYLHL